jgi:hypothetical protein
LGVTRITIANDRLKVEVLGWDKLWSFKSHLDFPMAHVIAAHRSGNEAKRFWRGIRAPGTNLPGVIVAGTYYSEGEHLFYDVHDFKQAIVIELKDEWYTRLIVEVEEPDEVLRFLPSSVEAAV